VRPRLDAPLAQRLAFQPGIAALFGMELRPRIVVVVDHHVLEMPRRPVEQHDLMDGPRRIVARMAATQQPQLVIRVEAAEPHTLARDVVVPRHPPPHLGPLHNHPAHLRGQLRRDALIGIHEEDPLRIDGIQGGVALTGKVIEGPLQHLGARCLRDLDCAVGAVRIGYDDAIGEAQHREAVTDVARLVLRQNHDCQLHRRAVCCIPHVRNLSQRAALQSQRQQAARPAPHL